MNRVSSIFSQLLKEVPAPVFQFALDTHHGERHARHHHRRNLQATLAGGVILQGHQTEPAHQEFRRNQRQCPENPNLDSIDRLASDSLLTDAQQNGLAPVALHCIAAPLAVRLSGSLAIPRPALRWPANNQLRGGKSAPVVRFTTPPRCQPPTSTARRAKNRLRANTGRYAYPRSRLIWTAMPWSTIIEVWR